MTAGSRNTKSLVPFLFFLWFMASLRRWLVFVFHILKARARAAGAGVYGRDERVAVGVEKLTRGCDSKLVAVNLEVPHEPLHASLEYRRVKENEGVPNAFVGIALGVAPDAEARCPLARKERRRVHNLGERVAASERQQKRKGRDRSARLAVSRIELHPPRPL